MPKAIRGEGRAAEFGERSTPECGSPSKTGGFQFVNATS